jgi:hypothetical protein
MQLIKTFKRAWRRMNHHGDPFLLDFELAALQALCISVGSQDAAVLRKQIVRYDRVSRSPDLRKQILVDDDSDFERNDWPAEIVFSERRTTHIATLNLSTTSGANAKKVSIRAHAFMVFGKLDGFEFQLKEGVPSSQMAMPIAMDQLQGLNSQWSLDGATLYAPFSEQRSSRSFDE